VKGGIFRETLEEERSEQSRGIGNQKKKVKGVVGKRAGAQAAIQQKKLDRQGKLPGQEKRLASVAERKRKAARKKNLGNQSMPSPGEKKTAFVRETRDDYQKDRTLQTRGGKKGGTMFSGDPGGDRILIESWR